MELGFKLHFADHIEYISRDSLKGETTDNKTVYKTIVDHANVEWTFEQIPEGEIISLEVTSDSPLGINRIDSIVFDIDF